MKDREKLFKVAYLFDPLLLLWVMWTNKMNVDLEKRKKTDFSFHLLTFRVRLNSF